MSYGKERFVKYLEEKSIKYMNLSQESVSVKFQGRKTDFIDVIVTFPDNGENVVTLRCWSIAHLSADRQQALEISNRLNDTYGFIRTAVNKDGDVCLAADAYYDERTCAVVAYKLLKAMLAYADVAYEAFSTANNG